MSKTDSPIWVKTLEWYGEKAAAISGRINDKNAGEYLMAIMTELALDGGRRAGETIAIESPKEDQQPSGDVEPKRFSDMDDWQLKLIGRAEERYYELVDKEYSWQSFYHGWLEGRFDMMKNKVKEDTPAGVEDQKQFLDYIYWPKEWFEKVATYCRENKITPIDLIENKAKEDTPIDGENSKP